MKPQYGKVYVHDLYAGKIEKIEDRYVFTYDQKYLDLKATASVSLTMPKRAEPYKSKTLFSFFDGLIPEGWLLQLASKNWKIPPDDRWTLLLTVCADCIGAVHVIGEE